MSIFPLISASGNPHVVSDYEYYFRLKPGTRLEFGKVIGRMIERANARLSEITLGRIDPVTKKEETAYDYMHIDKVRETLIGPNAGEIRLVWAVKGLALLPIGGSSIALTSAAAKAVDQIAQVIAAFDGELREKFIEHGITSNITVLGTVHAVEPAVESAF